MAGGALLGRGGTRLHATSRAAPEPPPAWRARGFLQAAARSGSRDGEERRRFLREPVRGGRDGPHGYRGASAFRVVAPGGELTAFPRG